MSFLKRLSCGNGQRLGRWVVVVTAVAAFAHFPPCVAGNPPDPQHTARSAEGTPPRLTQEQWHSLFRAAAKRITSLRVNAIIIRRSYFTRFQMRLQNKTWRAFKKNGTFSPSHWKQLKQLGAVPGWTVPGYMSSTAQVQLDWDIPGRLVNARRIRILRLTPEETQLLMDGDPWKIAIWVVGRRLAWFAYPGAGTWRVTVRKRSSEWSQYRWLNQSSTFGLTFLKYAVNPLAPFASGRFTHRLLHQKYHPATGKIDLDFACLVNGKPVTVAMENGFHGQLEDHYVLKLAGGLRVYRRVSDVVNGTGREPGFDYSFRSFKKTGGIWFPTKIRERIWNMETRLVLDTHIMISHVAVNNKFPPHTFRYSPPFGAHIDDKVTHRSYYVGSTNPSVPPAMPNERTSGTRGGK